MGLGKYWDLPKDARTLLKTPASVEIKIFSDGDYAHFGIRAGLEEIINSCQQQNINSLSLSFNIDGLPLFKSSVYHFWPILCMVNEMNSNPFIVGIFYGRSKPANVSDYLKEFISDLKDILQNPTISGKEYNISVCAFICDAPARAFIKCTKSYNGYYGCERCIQKGKWLGRMTYPEIDSPSRKNDEFLRATESGVFTQHVTGISPLLDLNIDLVSMFPLDYMHLVCLGVIRKILVSWTAGPQRLGNAFKQKLSQNLLSCVHSSPKEFKRKPRSVHEVDRWKATEFRSFLLYTGPVVLKEILPKDKYYHFLCLHIAIRIMLSEILIDNYFNYAKEMLLHFVKSTKDIYGEEFLVYNIHYCIYLKMLRSLEV